MRSRIRATTIVSLLLGFNVAAPADDVLSREHPTGTAAESDLDPRAALGMRLFTDTRLSATRNVSCATCHVPQRAFTDGLQVAIGINNQRGTRNTPSLWNVGSLPNQFWDGRRESLEEQALDPLLNPREHGLTSADALIAEIRSDERYVATFKGVFDAAAEQIRPEHVAAALAAFERTLIADASSFDLYYYENRKGALSAAAVRGFDLFRERARCASCHTLDGKRAQFTDQQFHRLGIGLDSVLPRLAALSQRVASADARTVDRLIAEEVDVAALGHFIVTKDPRDIGEFRTPSLRNVALTAPYMHDGSIATLEAALESEIYYRSLEQNRPLILTPKEKDDLIAFLRALTSSNAKTFSVSR